MPIENEKCKKADAPKWNSVSDKSRADLTMEVTMARLPFQTTCQMWLPPSKISRFAGERSCSPIYAVSLSNRDTNSEKEDGEEEEEDEQVLLPKPATAQGRGRWWSRGRVLASARVEPNASKHMVNLSSMHFFTLSHHAITKQFLTSRDCKICLSLFHAITKFTKCFPADRIAWGALYRENSSKK
jgi:hypothetical protein